MKKADFHGAGNEIRTRDSKLGKLVLYQLSYARVPVPNVGRYDKNWTLSIDFNNISNLINLGITVPLGSGNL